MASMIMKSSALLNCGATQRSLRVKCNAEADSESKKASPGNDIFPASTSTQSAQIPTRSSAAPAPFPDA
ncbi:hypothetical protein SUGI_0867690 [Cryptomeria japonica]|nr:hypothetical protein SUGI_0867690 [Cryptomeria japonica]